MRIPRRHILVSVLFLTASMGGKAERPRLLDSLQYRAELQTTIGTGDHSPLWLNANRYGLSSLKTSSGYVRGALERPLAADNSRRWGIGYGVDAAVAAGFTSTLVLQQAYVEGRWLKGVLTIGAKELPMELKNAQLSSGSQTLGINARPVPQVRLSLPDYWAVPGTRQWLSLKGHLAFGRFTDDGWQKDFTQQRSRYTEGTLFHSKAGYVKIGPGPVSVEAGLELATQFGGKAILFENGQKQVIENEGGLKSMVNALLMSGSDATDGSFKNVEGNHLGSWVVRVNIDQPSWNLGLYADQFFEDHSMMTHYSKSGGKYFVYDFKDWLLGVELRLKRTDWLQAVVVEYMYTKYQGGPVYHDHTPSWDVQISGRDNYYNHAYFTGWQHWGQVMGNPLYLSPLYNADGSIEVKHNRFVAWHMGVSGQPHQRLHYRLLATTQKSYGSYYNVPSEPEKSLSLMAEVQYQFPKGGWSIRGAAGMDSGKLRGDNFGFQLGIIKRGLLK